MAGGEVSHLRNHTRELGLFSKMGAKVMRSLLCLKRIISADAVSKKTDRRLGQMQGNQLGEYSSHLGRDDGVWNQGGGCRKEGWAHSGCALTLEPRNWMSVPQGRESLEQRSGA